MKILRVNSKAVLEYTGGRGMGNCRDSTGCGVRKGRGRISWVTGTLKDWYEHAWEQIIQMLLNTLRLRYNSCASLWIIALNKNIKQKTELVYNFNWE